MDLIISKRMQDLIEKVVVKYPKSRSNDKLLCLLVWEQQGFKLTQDQKDYFMAHCTSPETVTRNRRKLEETKKWLFPPEVQAQRSFLADSAGREFRR